MGQTSRRQLPWPDMTDTASIQDAVEPLANALDNFAIDLFGTFATRPTSSPGSPGEDGRYYWATDQSVLYRDNGTGWDAINPKDAAAGTSSLRQLGTGSTHAAAGDDVRFDSFEAVRKQVRVASTATVNTASPGASIDGVSLSSGDRVLLKNQSAATDNGIWVWNGAASAMARAADLNESAELDSGFKVTVREGAVNGDSEWMLITDGTITIGSSSLTFVCTPYEPALYQTVWETWGVLYDAGAIGANTYLFGPRPSGGSSTDYGLVTATTAPGIPKRYINPASLQKPGKKPVFRIVSALWVNGIDPGIDMTLQLRRITASSGSGGQLAYTSTTVATVAHANANVGTNDDDIVTSGDISESTLSAGQYIWAIQLSGNPADGTLSHISVALECRWDSA